MFSGNMIKRAIRVINTSPETVQLSTNNDLCCVRSKQPYWQCQNTELFKLRDADLIHKGGGINGYIMEFIY